MGAFYDIRLSSCVPFRGHPLANLGGYVFFVKKKILAPFMKEKKILLLLEVKKILAHLTFKKINPLIMLINSLVARNFSIFFSASLLLAYIPYILSFLYHHYKCPYRSASSYGTKYIMDCKSIIRRDAPNR